jgi:hypothetical protein
MPRKVILTLPMVLKLCSLCISIELLKMTRRWWKIGKAIQMEYLSSCVFRLPPILLRITKEL